MMTKALLGTWVVDPTDDVARDRFGEVAMCFDANGSLRYMIRAGDQDQIMLLRYRVEGDELVTDQPSAPREDRTQFSFTWDGRLVLNYGEFSAHYVRQSAVGAA